MTNNKYDYLFKLLIVGESGVGERCFLLHSTDDPFTSDNFTKLGIDYRSKFINLDNELIRLHI